MRKNNWIIILFTIFLLTGCGEKVSPPNQNDFVINPASGLSDILRAVDITVPALPEISGRYDDSSIEEIFATGNYIYVCNNDSLQVLYLEAGDEN